MSTVSAWLCGLCGVVSFAFAYVAWQRAGLPYNEEGHYFDGLVNYHEQSVLVFALLSGLALLLALGLLYIQRRAGRR
ncbi:MAG: hypothetical protein Q8R72_01685 [Hylemonella sp.]|nr:hypothetical protein [Hylemonella sp.]